MELQTKKREITGRKVEKLREAGSIPAELYGHGIPNIHIAVKAHDFEKIYKEAGENTIIKLKVKSSKLKVEDEEPKSEEFDVLIYDIQRNPLTDKVLAIDFYQVRMDEKIEIAVPLNFMGESPAIKEGGVLIKAMDEVEIEALPQDLPDEIDVDLSKLAAVGDSLYVRDLPKSDKYKYTVGPDTVVASITEQTKEEEAPAASLTPDQVVAETEEKKAERQAKASSALEGGAPNTGGSATASVPKGEKRRQ